MAFTSSISTIIHPTYLVLQADSNIVTLEEAEKVKAYIDKVRAIKDVLRRDHMKVAFFGR